MIVFVVPAASRLLLCRPDFSPVNTMSYTPIPIPPTALNFSQ